MANFALHLRNGATITPNRPPRGKDLSALLAFVGQFAHGEYGEMCFTDPSACGAAVCTADIERIEITR